MPPKKRGRKTVRGKATLSAISNKRCIKPTFNMLKAANLYMILLRNVEEVLKIVKIVLSKKMCTAQNIKPNNKPAWKEPIFIPYLVRGYCRRG